MKARAKHWLNYGGEWHETGDVFEIAGGDVNRMAAEVDLIPDPSPAPAPDPAPAPAEPEKAVPKKSCRISSRRISSLNSAAGLQKRGKERLRQGFQQKL